MNDIMNFLVDNYIYVAAGSLFVIVVLIGFLVSSGKKRKKENSNPDMVSMSDVKTGSINEVSSGLENQNDMKPLNISDLPQSNINSINAGNQGQVIMPANSMEENLTASENMPVEEPVQNFESFQPTTPVESIQNENAGFDVKPEVNPTNTLEDLNNKVEETETPVDEVQQDVKKDDETEIMDFMDVEENVNTQQQNNVIDSTIDRDDTQTF